MKKLLTLIALLSLSFNAFTQADETFTADHTGALGLGFAIGGGGIVGVPVRYYIGPASAIELGAFYRPVIYFDYFDEVATAGSVMLVAGPQFSLGQKFKESKRKSNSNGIFLKGGHSFGTFSESLIAGGWALETFRENSPQRSFVFELGAGLNFRHWVDDPFLFIQNDIPNTAFIIFWKLHWNWFVGK